jgi:hypothetical protein
MAINIKPGENWPPRITPSAPSGSRYRLPLHTIAPEDITPNGDRYLIEIIDVEDTLQLGQLLIVTQDPNVNPMNPQADPTVEARGVLVGVVLTAGNGHLLGFPDPALVTPRYEEVIHDFPKGSRDAIEHVQTGHDIEREWANVTMFYEPGDVVLVDRNARGRNLRVVNREIRIIGQIDVLAKIEGIRLTRVGDTWEPEEVEVDAQE